MRLSRRALFALPVALPAMAVAKALPSTEVATSGFSEWVPVDLGSWDSSLVPSSVDFVHQSRREYEVVAETMNDAFQRWADDLDIDPSDTDPPDIEIDDRAFGWEG